MDAVERDELEKVIRAQAAEIDRLKAELEKRGRKRCPHNYEDSSYCPKCNREEDATR